MRTLHASRLQCNWKMGETGPDFALTADAINLPTRPTRIIAIARLEAISFVDSVKLIAA